jgi:hypothetical protein
MCLQLRVPIALCLKFLMNAQIKNHECGDPELRRRDTSRSTSRPVRWQVTSAKIVGLKRQSRDEPDHTRQSMPGQEPEVFSEFANGNENRVPAAENAQLFHKRKGHPATGRPLLFKGE